MIRGTIVFLLLLVLAGQACSEEYMSLAWNQSAKQILSGLAYADTNGDGFLEIVAGGSSDGQIYVFDKSGREIWRKGVGSYVNTVHAADITGDGADEVIVGHTNLNAYGKDGQDIRRWFTEQAYEIAHGDLDGDGINDIVFISYNPQKCANSLVIAFNSTTADKLWQHNFGAFLPSAIRVFDSNGDGKGEVLVGLTHRGLSQGACARNVNHQSKAVLLSSAGQVIWEFETAGGVTSLGVGGDSRIAVGSVELYVLDYGGELLWKNNNVVTSYVDDIEFADLTGDGVNEIIVASNEVHAFSQEGGLLWTGLTDSRTYTISSGDLDGDGLPEIIAGSGSIYVFSGAGRQLWRSSRRTSYNHLLAGDIDGDGLDEVIAGSGKSIYVYKSTDYARRLLAEKLMEKAVSRPTSEADIALSELRQARQIFSENNMIEKVALAINEIDRRTDMMGRLEGLIIEADAQKSKAFEYYGRGDCINAVRHAHVGLQKYKSPGMSEEDAVGELEGIIEGCRDQITVNASHSIQQAFECYSEGDFESALWNARNASHYFSLIGDERAHNASALVSELEGILGVSDEPATPLLVMPDFRAVMDKVRGLDPIVYVGLLALISIAAFFTIVSFYFFKISKRKRLDSRRLHKRSYQERGNLKETVDEALRLGKRGGNQVREYSMSSPHGQQVNETQPVHMKNPATSRMLRVERYNTVNDILDARDHVDPDNTVSEKKHRYYTPSFTQQSADIVLEPKKGVLKLSRCGKGLCVKSRRLVRRRF
jgi:hypothetical protein